MATWLLDEAQKFCGSIFSSANINEGHNPWHTRYNSLSLFPIPQTNFVIHIYTLTSIHTNIDTHECRRREGERGDGGLTERWETQRHDRHILFISSAQKEDIHLPNLSLNHEIANHAWRSDGRKQSADWIQSNQS